MISLDSVAGYPDPVVITKPLIRHPSRRSIRLPVKLRLTAYVLLFLYASFAVFFVSGGFAQAQQAPPKKNVLVLHGLWRIRTWEVPFNSRLHNELLADKAVTAGITHVYLGLEDFPDNVYPRNFIEELRDRLEKNPVDLVIPVLPVANRFLLSYGQELFPSTPKVFVVPGTRDIQELKKVKNAVIIPSQAEKALQTTVARIFSLLPNTNHLVVVCGDGFLDRNYLEIAKRAIASSKRAIEVSYLVGLPLDELWRRVSSLAPDTAILFNTYDQDRNGKKQEAKDVAIRLVIRANAPVFTFLEALLGIGTIGGNVTSSESYGKNTAEATLRLLQGEQPMAISPSEQITLDVYDWRALKRWNISEDRLPPGSQVRYKTETLWETYRVYITIGIAVICLEATLIFTLFFFLMQSKRRKEALQESEESYQSLYENVPVGVYRTSNSGKFISINPEAFKIVGFDAEEDLSSYPVTEFYNDPEQRRDFLNQLESEGKVIDFETELRRKDGSSFWGTLSATQVKDKDGKFIFIDGVVQDISERKQAEAELKLKDSAIASSINGIGIADLEGTLIYVNDSLVKMWGYGGAEEIVGRPVADFFAGDGAIVSVETLMRRGRKVGEGVGKKKDGSLFDIEFTANLINNEAGKPVHMFSSFFDISKRKKLQEGLLQSKEFNHSVLMSLPAHLVVLDVEGTVLTINDSWAKFTWETDACSLCCAEPGVNYLRNCREASDKGDAIATDAHNGIRSLLDGSSPYFEMEFACDSPTVQSWFLMTVSPFIGLKGGVIVALTNITSQKTAEIKFRKAYTTIEQLREKLEAESAYLQDEIKLEHNFENIIGQSEALEYVLHQIEQVAPLDSTVLVLGETGTGKELMERALHKLSSHSKRTLVKVNCAALPGELIESELFGREKGAFTGATETQLGRFELANGSTLFLDEIGELPLALQAKLLRVLESGEFERLGSSLTLHSDARIIAATNRDLEVEVREGRFREDLWYRLKVFPITAPPLRVRIEDIPLLVKWFIEFFTRKMGKPLATTEIPKRTMQTLQSYSWPGNIRELKHIVESALIASKGKKLHFTLPKATVVAISDFKSLEEMERQYILDVLKAKNWKIGGEDSAASTLGMNVNTLRGRMKKLGINKPAYSMKTVGKK